MLLPGDAFKCESEQLFRGIVVCPSQIPEDDRAVLWAMVTYHGGQCQLNLNPKCSHLVIPCPTGAKYECALKHSEIIKIVTPSWVVDSVKENKLQDEANYAPCRAEQKTQSETTSSLLTPDDNDRTTTTPLSASLPQETSPPSTPAGVSSKAPITLPSTLMSPISPVTTVMAEDKTSTAVSSLTVSENSFAKTSEHTWKERQKSIEDKENVVEVLTEAVKIGENNNEVLLSDKENKGGSDEKGKEKSPNSKGSSCLAGCVFTISDYQDCMDHDILDTWMEVIELHGGVVSPFYGKRCSHLLCLNQHGSLYKQ
ncbi:PREDICTED: PAX-interacting protein 1-like, partial [Acropora digitifera]|uniref:PAX-interacting protein 1-like n=1 Tax=Acropora digitifera TaxID=70779 RepID=UPI00077A6634